MSTQLNRRTVFLRPLALATGMAVILSGCKVTEYSGVVQDGYIKGAKVCVDVNANAACDADEAWTLSQGSKGKFKLYASDENMAMVAVAGTDAIDNDTGLAITSPFSMSAPAGYTRVINPLTTLVRAAMVDGQLDAAAADAQISARLGVSKILDVDYIASGDTAAHGIAQQVAGLLAATQAQIADATTENIQLRALIALKRQIDLTLQAGHALSSVVVTRGDIFAVNLNDAANPRNAAAHAGEVEVLAGTGYHKTLFDSADNKCQNCHNDLYDTWKKSMHSQSWSDQIFQNLYQDYLRMSLSRIGSSGPGGVYTEARFKGASQVCIKCHAPAAYYSSDFDVQLTVLSNDPVSDYASLKTASEFNLSPAYDVNQVAKVVSVSADGKVYQASYHVGNKHNREGINCAFCHSVETVRLMNSTEGDMGQYKLAKNLTMGPIGPVVRNAGDTLYYNSSANNADMNAFFVLVGPEKYSNPGNTPKDFNMFDVNKTDDGRFTMKSIPTGMYTGGPFYGPYGITGLGNSRSDDTLDRHALVNPAFVAAGSKQHMEDYGKGFCLSCHQRSAGALNPETNGVAGVQVGEDQFMELCTTWSAMSTNLSDNYTSTAESPKCQKCHMERVDNKVVLHKWNDPSSLFTAADGVTSHFDPDSGVGPVAEGYLNNHAFMGANAKDFGTGKIKSGFGASLNASLNNGTLNVETSLLNKTAHMFPGAHPMRRVLTRVVVTDANGTRLNYTGATGNSGFESVVNKLATLPGESVVAGRDQVTVAYNPARSISFPGLAADLTGGAVTSQQFDGSKVNWEASFGTVSNPGVVQLANGSWSVQGQVGVNKIIDSADTSHFTRIYGRETGKKDPANSATFVVRPGFDSNIARDNRLLPNERETYNVSFDASNAVGPISVTYKVYYMTKGAGGQFPTGANGFLNTALDAATLKKLAIHEVFSQTVQVQ